MTTVNRSKSGAKVGEYKKPGADDVRGPCPAVNSLANHGYLPRDGKYITKELLMDALQNQYHLSQRIAFVLATTVLDPENPLGVRPSGQEKEDVATGKSVPYIHLNQLNTHNRMEHDVSMFHLDAYQGDHTVPQKQMVENFIAESQDGVWLTWKDIARYKAKRYHETKKKNPDMVYTVRQMFTSWAEAAVIMLVLGGTGKHQT
ncbi:Chloroperoxidase [Obelidium mucronatum]|nr:Chloroperoxidase [Obelidium mucronatum]